MSLTSSMQIARKETIGDVEVEFPRLTVSDLGSISADIVNERKNKAKQIAKDANYVMVSGQAGIGPFELFSIMQEIEDKVPSVSELYSRAHTSSGAIYTIKVSLKKSGKNDEQIKVILDNMDAVETIDIAKDLITCRRIDKEELVSKKEESTSNAPDKSDVTPVKAVEAPAGFGDQK